MYDVTDGLRMIVARPSNHREVFVERRAPIEDNTQHLHVLGHHRSTPATDN